MTTDIDHDGVRWEGNGSYTPTCVLCGYEGKRQAKRALAATAVRQHRHSGDHRAAARRLALTLGRSVRP